MKCKTMKRILPPLTLACVVMLGVGQFPRFASAQDVCGRDDCVGDRQISAVTVQHLEQIDETTVREVEPDTGETIEVTAYWDVLAVANPVECECEQTATASVTVDVDWSDATDSWSATCTGCNSSVGPIFGVTVCHTAGCGSGVNIDNAWEYELVADIAQINGVCDPMGMAVDGFLSKVEYETTSVDDGDAIRTSNCTELASVSPTSQTFSVTDFGRFECVNTCAAASGPTLALFYE